MQINISSLKDALYTVEESVIAIQENKHSNLITLLEDSAIKRFEYTLKISKKQ